MTTNLNFTMYQHDTLTITPTVNNQQGSIVDLTSATITFAVLGSNGSVILSKTTNNNTVIIESPATNGVFQIPITATDSSGLSPATYNYMVRVTDKNNNSQIVLTGTLTILASLI